MKARRVVVKPHAD